MTSRLFRMLAIIPFLAISTSVLAQQPPSLKLEDAVHYRKAGYAFMHWNMKKLKAMLDDSRPIDKQQARAAANAIHAAAHSGMGALYVPGSDQDAIGENTRLKADFFRQPEKVRKVAKTYRIASDKLADAAVSAEREALKAAFGEMAKACKACHKAFRED